jgi:hypothetical protein
MHRPPKNDRERLENLLEALSEPEDEDDALDEEIHAELARRGLTMESWAAQLQAQAQAVIDRSRRARAARRVRVVKIAAVGAAGLAAAAGVALAVQSLPGPTGDASAVNVMRSPPPLPAATAIPAADAGPAPGSAAPRRGAPHR